MHGGANDIGHHIAGGENDGARLDLAPACQTDIDRAPGGIERNSVCLEQPCTARQRCPEQSMRQFHRIGIGRTRRDDRTGTREAKAIKQHGMIEKIAGQAGARPPAMLLHQAVAALVRRKIQRILVAHVAGNAEPPDQRFQAGDGIAAGTIGA